MRKVRFVYPGDIERPTGGYAYARNMIAELRQIGWDVEAISLDGRYPLPTESEKRSASERLSEIPEGSLVVVDGLAYGALPEAAAEHGQRLLLAALIHHPLAHETGLDSETGRRLRESESRALACAHHVIATSHMTARILSREFDIPSSLISVVPPGLAPFGRAPCKGDPPVVLALGSVIPRKGHDVLIAALRLVADLEWTCRIVGETRGEWAEKIKNAAGGLGERIVFTGAVAYPSDEILNADLFVLPSRYEGYGMAYAEALAAGLPVIGCPVGALPEILPEDAGVIVPVDDVHALSQTLRDSLESPQRRRAMTERAYAAGRNLPTWAESARAFSMALDEASHVRL